MIITLSKRAKLLERHFKVKPALFFLFLTGDTSPGCSYEGKEEEVRCHERVEKQASASCEAEPMWRPTAPLAQQIPQQHSATGAGHSFPRPAQRSSLTSPRSLRLCGPGHLSPLSQTSHWSSWQQNNTKSFRPTSAGRADPVAPGRGPSEDRQVDRTCLFVYFCS